MTYGWNKGVRLALRAVQEHPENVLIVRYEDFVRSPEQRLEDICSFCDLAFNSDLLDIYHVNRSESPYNQSSVEKGINASRVGYYDESLTDVEVEAVRTLIDDRLVGRVYPELTGEAAPSLLGASYAAGLALAAVLTTGGQHLRTLLAKPRHALHRVKKRLLS